VKLIGTLALVVAAVGASACNQNAPLPDKAAPVQQEVAALAADAVRMAKSEGVVLDYSVESVARVEVLLAKVYDTGSLSEDQAIDVGRRYGAYVGEVLRRKWGGRWEQNHPHVGPNTYPLHLPETDAFPMAWCVKRLMNGPEDNVWNKVQRAFLNQGPAELKEHPLDRAKRQ
jgi:hypothetical protein